MSVVEMEKVNIVSLKSHKDAVLKCLKDCELVEMQSIKEVESETISAQELGKYEFDLAEIKSALSFLEEIMQKKKSFIEGFIPPKEEISEDDLINTAKTFNLSAALDQIKGLETRLSNLKNLENELHSELAKLLPWKKLDTPLDTLTPTPHTNLALGSIKNKHFASLKAELDKISPAAIIDTINTTKESTYLLFVFLKEDSKLWLDTLSKWEFIPADLPHSPKTPVAEISHVHDLLAKTKLETDEVLLEAKNLGQELTKLKYMYDFILDKKLTLETQQKLTDTNYAFVISGWIRKRDLDKLKNKLNQVTNEFDVLAVAPAKGETAPVALKNAKIFSPFELITMIYGAPNAKEFDPSVVLSFFFALFFGICLGDFFYGIILSLVSIYFLKKYKLPKGGQELFELLLLGGIVASVVGILTGSYLGFTPADLPSAVLPIKNFLTSIQIIDPIKNPLTMLVFSLALGVIQILFGIILQMIERIRAKQYISAILDDGLWLFFLSSLVYLIVASALSLTSAGVATYMSIGGAAALVLTQGRHKKGIIQKFLSGLLSLYKVSGYMGDTLSYSRLLALGMSSTIIASVINILGGMVRTVPVLGIVLMIVILIVGHFFNILIATLSAFVHSTRLQMVEFFSKFYEGGGKEFRPFKREAEYTRLK
ncbi:MAG: V-type ATP synthase subunit I [Candidatus Saganbacteria bacterium]|nr:V-type ATP synthase subunit I [Candidatus Saganbacteria bacterium]